jgi:hypothetical protein
MADELIVWLRVQLDTDEQTARRAGANDPTWAYDRETFTVSTRGGWSIAARKDDGSPINDVDGEHIAEHDPARVLRQVAAFRAILDEHPPLSNGACDRCDEGAFSYERKIWPCPTVRALASVYSRRPGYQPEWAP